MYYILLFLILIICISFYIQYFFDDWQQILIAYILIIFAIIVIILISAFSKTIKYVFAIIFITTVLLFIGTFNIWKTYEYFAINDIGQWSLLNSSESSNTNKNTQGQYITKNHEWCNYVPGFSLLGCKTNSPNTVPNTVPNIIPNGDNKCYSRDTDFDALCEKDYGLFQLIPCSDTSYRPICKLGYKNGKKTEQLTDCLPYYSNFNNECKSLYNNGYKKLYKCDGIGKYRAICKNGYKYGIQYNDTKCITVNSKDIPNGNEYIKEADNCYPGYYSYNYMNNYKK